MTGAFMAAAFSHVIFDLDGTILNTLEDLAAAGNHTCEMHGWPTFAVDEYRYKALSVYLPVDLTRLKSRAPQSL